MDDPAMEKWHKTKEDIRYLRIREKEYGFNLDDLNPKIPFYVDPVYKAALRKYLMQKYPEDYKSMVEWQDLDRYMWIDECIEYCHTRNYTVLAKGPHVGLIPKIEEKSKSRVFIQAYVVADAGINSSGDERFFILSALDLTCQWISKQRYNVKTDNTLIEDGKDGFRIIEGSIFYLPDKESGECMDTNQTISY